MSQSEERKVMAIIDRLSQREVEIPAEEILARAREEGVKDPPAAIASLEEQGLVIQEGGKVSKIAKRLFW